MKEDPWARPDEAVANVEALCKVLCELLDREHELMREASVEALPVVLEHKQRVLDDLRPYEAGLVERFRQLTPTDASPLHAVREAMRDCRRRGQRNRELAAVGLGATRRSLEVLRRALKLNDLTLYGADGELVAHREKRHLGSL